MSTVTQPKDPRREHLRQQAILRRQQVLDRIVGTRYLLLGGVVAATGVMVGYMDASRHQSANNGSGSGLSAIYGNYGSAGSNYGGTYGSGSGNYGGGSGSYGGGSSNYGGGSSGGGQSQFGGGTPPSSSSGSGGVVSGGS